MEEREIYRVIARMLAKKPAERFQKAEEVIVALGGHLIPHAITTDPLATAPTAVLSGVPTEPTPTESPTRWMTFAAIVALVVGIPALAFVRQKDDPPPAPTAAVIPTTKKQAPPIVQGAPVSTPAKVAAEVAPPKPKPKPPPKPSARAAAILAYNRVRSNCPRTDTLVTSKPIEYAALMDSLPDRARGNEMTVAYDVCGLRSGSSVAAQFTLTKLRQRGFGQQTPHVEVATVIAKSPRSRQTRTLDIHEMSAGSYRLELVVTAAGDRVTSVSREFRITDK
jgi:hypothetical protein